MLATAAVLLAPAACVGIFDVWGPSGTYDLSSANGQRVPAVVFSQSGTSPLTITLLGGQVRLRDDHSFRMDVDYLEFDGHQETRYTQGISGHWSEDRETVWLDYFDPDTGDRSSLAANEYHDQLEMTIAGATDGTTIRIVFVR